MLRRLAVLALLLALAGGAAAQNGRPYESRFDIPERPSPPRLVNDFTGTLTSSEVDALERKLVAFADSAGSQVAVVVVQSTNDVAPVDFATEVLREWGVGRAGIDDGVVLLVALADREVFITTGFGAEGALTDATSATIIRNVLVPRFREGAYYAGIDQATDAIVAALSGEFEAPSAATGSGEGGIPSVLCVLFVIFIVLVVLSSRHGPPPPSSGSGGGRRRRRGGPGFVVIPTGAFGGGGGGGFGGGGFGGGFGGGGFGGFGGGFGGGGGAGGSW
ncbi:TPM domain-containing protein [Rubrivirga sp. IMCC45206]|uniref:TPM domain-containing protein n=1 Tax=Rubrivirga sp. IMCC45206 TaxID=3391614 RepID=UPI00399014E4